MTQIFYDLTELLYLSRGYKGYYGIAKVVAEGAKTAFKLDKGIRFVAYNQGFDGFIEVFPTRDDNAEGGVELNIPNAGLPLFTRRVYPIERKGEERLAKVLGPLVNLIERLRWYKTGVPFKKIDLTGGIFVSCARPKLMIHPIKAVKQFPGTQVHALLHDAIPIHDLELSGKNFTSSFQADTSWVIENADQIIGNSEFSAFDLERFAERGKLAKAKRMSVAQLAHECRKGEGDPELAIPDRPYVLMVGTMLGRKNLDVALAALKRLVSEGKEPPLLVLAGRRRKRTMEFLDTEEMAAVKPHVLQVDSPSQIDLERLYNSCLAVVLPSRIEGWGLPAAEALWHGKPVFCSNIPVLHEVCGSMARYFDIHDDETLAGLLHRVTHDSEWRTGLERAVSENRNTLRTWDDFGLDLIARVEEAA